MITYNTNKMVEGMMAAGLPAAQALAVATSIEHSLTCEDYADQFGEFMVDSLKQFVKVATE